MEVTITVKYLFIISMTITVETRHQDIKNTSRFAISESIDKFSQALFQELNLGTSLLFQKKYYNVGQPI